MSLYLEQVRQEVLSIPQGFDHAKRDLLLRQATALHLEQVRQEVLSIPQGFNHAKRDVLRRHLRR